VQFEITEQTRAAVNAWITRRGLSETDYLFPSTEETTHVDEAVRRIVDKWVSTKIDAFLTATPEPQILRAQKNFPGHTIVNIAVDGPWSQYFCCMVAGSTDYVTKYPVATKRVLRAILKAADFCASNPELAAQALVDRGFLPNYDYAQATLKEAPHDKWRDYDAEDTVRFYALRMKETGMIKSSPQQIIADGTDFRFLNELKHELKT
jgi:NitT/TauT family transport system substrate-binding protein